MAIYKAGIVGCGKIAGINDIPQSSGFVGTHAQAYQRHPKFHLLATVNHSSEKPGAFTDKWNIPLSFQTLEEMLVSVTLDVVSLCTPSELHFQQLKIILESPNCPLVIFVEKPACLFPQELDELKAIASQKECLVMVNHTRRFDPGHIRLKSFINEGSLGRLLAGRCEYYGGWLHNGCHVVDTLYMLFGPSIKIEHLEEGSPAKKDDPCLNVILRIGDAQVIINSFDEKYYQVFESEFKFEHGRILLQDFGSVIIVEKVTTNELGERVLVPLENSPWKGLDSPLYHAILTICDYLERGNKGFSKEGVKLADVEKTMSLLWEGKAGYLAQRRISHG